MGVLDINLIIERGQLNVLGYKRGTGPMFLDTLRCMILSAKILAVDF